MDGSSFSMPDTDELQSHFGQSGGQARGCGFPTAHWLALVRFGSGLFQKVIAALLRTPLSQRRPQNYPLMNKPRAKLQQLLESQQVTN